MDMKSMLRYGRLIETVTIHFAYIHKIFRHYLGRINVITSC